MEKIKQNVSKKNQFQDQFNFQNWLETWSKESVDNFVKTFIHIQDKTTSKLKNEFQERTKKFIEAYYAQKAIAFQADENLPFKTLVLLGQKLSHPAYKEEVERIILENVIKLKGIYYKLDDLNHQHKIQKAIANYQFEECQPVDKAA